MGGVAALTCRALLGLDGRLARPYTGVFRPIIYNIQFPATQDFQLCIAGLNCLFLRCARRLRTPKSRATSFWCELAIFGSLPRDFILIYFWETGRLTRSWPSCAR